MNENYYPIPEKLFNAHISEEDYQRLYDLSLKDNNKFWQEEAKRSLEWIQDFHTVSDCNFSKGKISWFLGGKLNVCYNCLDRHLANNSDKTALIWIGNEPQDTKTFSYKELYQEVLKATSALRSLGLKKGDRLGIYLPMIPEAVFFMLASARIGAIHNVIFAGFSAESLRNRLIDSGCKILVTANVGLRGNKVIALKEIVDQALSEKSLEQQTLSEQSSVNNDLDSLKIEKVIVVKRNEMPVNMQESRDLYYQDLLANIKYYDPKLGENFESMDSEDPLFILYTSGSTGKPKGLVHTQAGYLLYASLTHKYVFDYQPQDIYFCAADIGWITGHSYVVYGPLANAATTVLFESLPTYPDAGRYWQEIEKHKVNSFYTAPTALRALAKESISFIKKYNLGTLKVLGSVGEPISPATWKWYYENVGSEKAAVVDTWWQTETGGILISNLPGAKESKSGFAGLPLFGIEPEILKAKDNSDEVGHLCIKRSWPGQARSIYGDHQRFVNTYFSQYPGYYFTGDGALKDDLNYFRVTGRVDDVINVSGHRLGTAEIESAALSSGIVAEAAVIAVEHEIKGSGICIFCIANQEIEKQNLSAEQIKKNISESVVKEIGPFARPDFLYLVKGLPKTRSGKIMRRVLRKIAEKDFSNLGDLTTLAEPEVIQQLIETVSSK